MKKYLAIILAIVTVLSVLAFAGCGKKDEQPNNDATNPSNDVVEATGELAEIKEKGKLIVGITEYPPMNFKNEKNEWTGFDTELTYAFAEKIGVDVEFVVLTDWGAKFTELKSGSIDCVWNGMTITDEALKNASVSDVYLKNSQVVVLPAAKASAVKTVEDLKDLTFAVEEGSAGQSIANDNKLKTVASKDMAMALLEASSGACDGCIIDKTMAEATVGEGTSYEKLAVSITLSTEEFGVAFRQDSNLTAEFNTFLKDYQASGDFAKLAAKYEINIEK